MILFTQYGSFNYSAYKSIKIVIYYLLLHLVYLSHFKFKNLQGFRVTRTNLFIYSQFSCSFQLNFCISPSFFLFFSRRRKKINWQKFNQKEQAFIVLLLANSRTICIIKSVFCNGANAQHYQQTLVLALLSLTPDYCLVQLVQ